LLAGLFPLAVARGAAPGSGMKEVLTNARVIKLAQSGMSDAALIDKIRRSVRRFKTSAKGLQQLRNAGVSEAVIGEMIRAQSGASISPATSEAQTPCVSAQARATTEGDQSGFDKLPPSRTFDSILADASSTHRLPPLAEQDAGQAQGVTKKLRIGTVRPLASPLNFPASGKCFDLGHAGYDNVLAVISEGARQVRVHFEQMALPTGAKLYVSSLKNPNETYGPYERRGLSDDGSFWTPPVEGEGVLIEYYRPRSVSNSTGQRIAFQITELSHIYKR
jgi:hypothetical protein